MQSSSPPAHRRGRDPFYPQHTYGTHMRITHKNSLRLAMQCTAWNNPTPFKGGYKRQSYAPSKERINPLVVNCYVPNESGELVLTKRVRPKAR